MNLFGYEFLPNIPNDTLYLAVAALVVVALIMLVLRRKKEDYPRKDIDVEGPKEIADMIKTANIKVFGDKIMLYDGPVKLGRVTKMMPWHFDSELSMRISLAKAKKKKELEALVEQVRAKGGDAVSKDEPLVDNFYIFEVIKDNPLFKILYIFGFGKAYHIADMKAVTEGYKQYSINIYMQPQHWFKNVYIYSKMSKAIALNIADRLTLKQTLNGVINYIPKMDYIEMKTAHYVAKAREYSDIKDKSWKKREENLEREVEAV